MPDRLCDRRRRLYRRPSFSSLAFSTGPPQSALVDSTMSSGELGGPGEGGSWLMCNTRVGQLRHAVCLYYEYATNFDADLERIGV